MDTPRNIAAPNLPNPSASYDQQSGQQFNNVLRLYFNQIDNAINSPKAAGSNYQVQYNLNGALAGSSSMTFNGTNLLLTYSIGIGTTPKAWVNYKAVQLSDRGSVAGYGDSMTIGANWYDGGAGAKRIVSAGVTRYSQYLGSHTWSYAGTGAADSAITFTDAMTLNNSGQLMVGGAVAYGGTATFTGANATVVINQTSSAGYAGLRIYNDLASNVRALEIDYSGSAYSGALVTGGPSGEQALFAATGNYPLVFATNNTFRGMFGAGGAFLVGANSPGSTSAKIMSYGDSTSFNLYVSQDTGTSYSTNNYFFTCYNSSSVVAGGIQHTGASTVTFATSSDYRLKTDVVDLTGSGAFVDGLRPVAFTWIEDQVRDVGFIAHEAQVVAPHSAGGVKDAVDADGKPVYQTMAYGSAEIIANLVAELQDLRKRVAALEPK